MQQLPKDKNLTHIVCESVGFVLLFVFLQVFCEYYWYPVGENNGLFLCTSNYFFQCLANPAGLLTYAGAFLAQCFVLPYCGALLLTLLCFIVYKLAQTLTHQLMPTASLPLCSLLLVAYTILLHIDADYHISGTLALISCIIVVLGYIHIEKKLLKALFIVVLIPIFSWLAGPAAIVAAASIAVIEIIADMKKGWLYLIAIPLAIFPLWLWYIQPNTETAEIAFLPNAYFYHYMSPGSKVWYPWIVVFAMIVIVTLVKRIKPDFKSNGKTTVFIQTVSAVTIFVMNFTLLHSKSTYQYLEVEHLRKTEQWTKLEAVSIGENSPSITINSYNLAVQKQGKLAEKVFISHLYGPGSLYTPYAGQPMLADLLSDIYFAHGNIAMSQKLAMNYMLSHEDALDGRSLLRLIDTNLLLGHHDVAEKYIKKLENTWLYRAAAASRRVFLHNNEAIAKDMRLGELYRCVPKDSTVVNSVVADLETILRTNPGYKPAKDFLDIYNKLLEENNQSYE